MYVCICNYTLCAAESETFESETGIGSQSSDFTRDRPTLVLLECIQIVVYSGYRCGNSCVTIIICNIVVLNGLIDLLEFRETAVSDRTGSPGNARLGEGPARGISEGSGRTPARIIML